MSQPNPNVQTAGGVVQDGEQLLLLVRPEGYAIPKGHIDFDELGADAAVREVLEETGYRAEVIQFIGTVTRDSVERGGFIVRKDIGVFLMTMLEQTDRQPDEVAAWVPIVEALRNMRHPEELQLLAKYFATTEYGMFRLADDTADTA